MTCINNVSMHLPPLSPTPAHHPDCCLSLSSTLPDQIIKYLPDTDSSIASIGCGSGLLEALLLQQKPGLKLVGVEVASCHVKYLPKDQVHIVKGTWDISVVAKYADVWLFVYPRTTKLLATYLEAAEAADVKAVMWIGPSADWMDFETVFRQNAFDDIKMVEDAGIAGYETMAVITRSVTQAELSKSTSNGESEAHVDAI
jgi:hypothetical protein